MGFCSPQPSWTAQPPVPHTSSPGTPCRIPALGEPGGHSRTLEGPNHLWGAGGHQVGSGRAEQGPAGSAHGHWVGTAPFSNSPCTLCILISLGEFTDRHGAPRKDGINPCTPTQVWPFAPRMDPEPGGAGLGATKSILKTIPFLSPLISHPAVPTTLVTHNRVPGILKHPQEHRAYPTPGAAMGEQGWASRAGTAGNAAGGSRIAFGRELNIDMASGASRGGVCHRGSRESREQESWAQCQAAVAHTAFLERRGLVGG